MKTNDKIHELWLYVDNEYETVEVSAVSRTEALKVARKKYGESAIIIYKGLKKKNA